MAGNIEKIADLMGATIVTSLPDTGGGAFGAARLVHLLRSRLQSPQTHHPDKTVTNNAWNRRSEVPMSEATERRLEQLAALASTENHQVTAEQVAGHLLEHSLLQYPS